MIESVYKVLWKETARNSFKNINRNIALKIYDRVENHLIKAPKQLGKALVGQYKGLYRYRYGDYRVLYEIDSENKSIIIVRIGNRKDIY